MSNNEDVILTDEELDDVVGGGSGSSKVYKYELKHHPTKGDYYFCTVFTDGVRTGCKGIGADRWKEFQKKVGGPGVTFEKM